MCSSDLYRLSGTKAEEPLRSAADNLDLQTIPVNGEKAAGIRYGLIDALGPELPVFTHEIFLAARPQAAASLRLPDHKPLLGDGQDIVHQPVQYQSRGKIEEQKGEDHGHEHHDLGLHGIAHGRRETLLQEHGRAHDERRDVVRVLGRKVGNMIRIK